MLKLTLKEIIEKLNSIEKIKELENQKFGDKYSDIKSISDVCMLIDIEIEKIIKDPLTTKGNNQGIYIKNKENIAPDYDRVIIYKVHFDSDKRCKWKTKGKIKEIVFSAPDYINIDDTLEDNIKKIHGISLNQFKENLSDLINEKENELLELRNQLSEVEHKINLFSPV